MSRIGDWLRRLVGRSEPEMPKHPPKARRPAAPHHAPPGELEIVDRPPPARPTETAAGGFDPYSSDAGYQKPHSWERVDHD